MANARTARNADPEIHPLTGDRWDDVVTLFGARGAYGGCWCMWFRKPNAAWVTSVGSTNERDLRALAEAGRAPGLLAYVDGAPAGWVSVAPRSEYTRISGVDAAPTDDFPPDDVWSIVCFYIAKAHRGAGIGKALLAEAVRHAAAHGATVVEGYPAQPKSSPTADENVYTGVVSMFEAAGFREVGRFARWRSVPQVTDPESPTPGPPTGRPIHRRKVRLSACGGRRR
jgi:GNAT superfamily N-acetyltransferase